MTQLVVSPANNQEFILLRELFKKMKIEYEPLLYNLDSEDDSEEWYKFSMLNLSRAYSEDEPEYSSEMLKEPNPNYNSF